MGGGGSSGAGEFAWPSYMQQMHERLLVSMEALVVPNSATFRDSPFENATGYNPDPWTTIILQDTAELEGRINAVEQQILAMDPHTWWSTNADVINAYARTELEDPAHNNDLVIAYAAVLRDILEQEVIPKFKMGMNSAGAGLSSSFVVGEAIIWASHNREVARFAADLRSRIADARYQFVTSNLHALLSAQQARMDNLRGILAAWEGFSRLRTEAARIIIVAKKEQHDQSVAYAEANAKWPINLLLLGGNLLASITGAATQDFPKQSAMGSVLGGALSGAAAGALMMPGNALLGGAIGAMVGGIGGLIGGR